MSGALFCISGAVPLMLFAGRLYLAAFSLAPNQPLRGYHLLGVVTFGLSSLAVGGLGGLVIWLLCARFVFRFSRSEVVRSARAGPRIAFLSGVDNWLINAVYGSAND